MKSKIKLATVAVLVTVLAAALTACEGDNEDGGRAIEAGEKSVVVTTVPDRTVPDNYYDPDPAGVEPAVTENEVPEASAPDTEELNGIERDMERARQAKENATTRDEYLNANRRYQEMNFRRAAYLQGFQDGQG